MYEKSLNCREPTPIAGGLESFVCANDAALFLGIHAKTVMRLAREGAVPAYSISDGTRHHWRFLLSELDKWMRSRINSKSHPVRPCPPNLKGGN